MLLLALACSGPTDIVGVVDDIEPSAEGEPAGEAANRAPAVAPSDTQAEAASAAIDVALLLAGHPVTNWPGDMLEWTLSTPLGELFASAPANGGGYRLTPATWPSKHSASSWAPTSDDSAGDVGGTVAARTRLLILDRDEAHQLLGLMMPTGGPGLERAGVFRDQLDDTYWLAALRVPSPHSPRVLETTPSRWRRRHADESACSPCLGSSWERRMAVLWSHQLGAPGVRAFVQIHGGAWGPRTDRRLWTARVGASRPRHSISRATPRWPS